MARPLDGREVDKVLAIESRGFIFGAALALRLRAGLVPARKVGKLPWKTRRLDYTLEYTGRTPSRYTWTRSIEGTEC